MKQVDELIRGEIAAVQSFDTVLKKLTDQSERESLNKIRADHAKAVDKLKSFADTSLDANIDKAGPWGAFTTAFAGGASFFGNKAAIQALKVGEEHGLNEYKEALEDDTVSSEIKNVIRSELLPQQEQHIFVIDGYLQ